MRTNEGKERRKRGNDRVPNLELDGLVIDGDHPGPELDADGKVMNGLEALVGELQQQARLADACSKAKPSQAGEGRQHHCRKRVRLDLHLAAAAAVAAGCEARGSNRGTEEGRGATGPTGRTCVADDDVLEEVGVRHLRWRARSSGNEELRGDFAESEEDEKKKRRVAVAGCFCLARRGEEDGAAEET